MVVVAPSWIGRDSPTSPTPPDAIRMSTVEPTPREILDQLEPGDRVEVVHEVKVGLTRWPTTTIGQVVRVERRRHGLHYQRNRDDKVFSDEIVLRRDDGELTTVALDEFTAVKKV